MQNKLFTSKNLILFALVASVYFVYLKSASHVEFDSFTHKGLTMGTFYRIEIVGDGYEEKALNKAFERAAEALSDVDEVMSTYKSESDISKFNKLLK